MAEFNYQQEIYRKLIHLSSLWTLFVIYLSDQGTALVVFATGAALILAYEIIRKQDNAAARFFNRLFGAALRPEEKTAAFRPSGAVYVLVAAFLCTLLFPQIIAITAMSMMLTADAAAALIGRRFGRRKVLGKSLEGMAAFFVTASATAWIISLCLPVMPGYAVAATGAALVAAIVELISSKLYLNDNLSIPLAAGIVMTILL